jgi:stalled ribosome rescue protein Dom34
VEDLGWERIVIAAEGQFASRFEEALPEALRTRVVATIDHNVGHDDLPAIAAIVEPLLADAWLERTRRIVAVAHERASAGGAAALGPQETLGTLGEGRVEHLLLDPDHDFSPVADSIPASIGPALIGERAVEATIAAGGHVSVLAVSDCEQLLNAGGMVALLRY